MRLPRFVRLSGPEIVSDLILETRPPFLIARAAGIPKKDGDRVEEMLADIANGRRAAVKVPGFTVFLTVAGTLSRGGYPDDEAMAVLRDMAEFWAGAVAEKKKHRYRVYEEAVPDDIDEVNGRKIRDAKAGGRKIFLEHK